MDKNILEGISINCHSSLRIKKDLVIYVDPFKIKENLNDADIILITHGHYDHFSIEDINKIKKDNTIILVTEDKYEDAKNLNFKNKNIFKVMPNEKYEIKNILVETIPAYNINKQFHPKENNWVGYVVTIEGIKYYIAGDTDITDENKNVKCDIAFIPIGGTYTMDYIEASNLINIINPSIVIPFHYGDIVGKKEDAIKFKELVNSNIDCEILIK